MGRNEAYRGGPSTAAERRGSSKPSSAASPPGRSRDDRATRPIQHGGNQASIRARLNLGNRPLLDFSAPLNALGPPEGAFEAVRSATESIDRYPEPGAPRLVERLADYHRVPSDRILVGAGTTELIAIESCRAAAGSAFGDPTVYVEKYVRNPRHIEVQVIADAHGNVVHLGERECSIQRRHQKIMEETPSPIVTPDIRRRMGEAAVLAARAAGYVNAGTVEFIFSDGDFYFLEVNARLQVEHPITETVTGVDLVKEQLRVAAGLPLSFSQGDVTWTGHAIEMRINAENPAKRFVPNPRRITRWVAPSGPGVRVDAGFGPGSDVPPNYDSLVAKLIVSGRDRAEAIARASRALREFVLIGPATTIPYHRAILDSQDFRAGRLSTHFIDDHPELLETMQRYLDERSPMDYGADPRHVAAAAAAAAAVVGGT